MEFWMTLLISLQRCKLLLLLQILELVQLVEKELVSAIGKIKEFQTSTSLPSSPISNSNKTLRLGEAIDVTFGRNDANMTFGPLAQEDNSFTYANSTVIQELDMEESLLAENGIMDASNVTGKIPRTNKGRKRVSFGHKQIKEFQTSTSLPSSPMSNAYKTLRLFDPMDITSGQSEMNMTFAALKNSNMNKALANGSTHQLDSTIFEEFDMEENSSEDEEKDIGNEQVPIPAVQPAIPLEPLPSGPSKLQTEPTINLPSNHAPCEVLKVALLVVASSLSIEVHFLKRNKMSKTQPQPHRGAFFDVKTPKRLEVNQNSRDLISTSPIILSPFSKVNTRVPRRSLSLIESGEPTFPKAQIQTHQLSSQGSNAGVLIHDEIQSDEQQNISNENQLNLSIELYNYVSNSVQIHGMKKIKFCDRVRQEIIQLPINVYDTFKLTYHNCFVTGFWDSVESHRKNLVKLM